MHLDMQTEVIFLRSARDCGLHLTSRGHVIPAEAGIYGGYQWIPAFAGTTSKACRFAAAASFGSGTRGSKSLRKRTSVCIDLEVMEL